MGFVYNLRNGNFYCANKSDEQDELLLNFHLNFGIIVFYLKCFEYQSLTLNKANIVSNAGTMSLYFAE